MRKALVHWEGLHTFNPAAVVKDGSVQLLSRAEDDSGTMKNGDKSLAVGAYAGGQALLDPANPTRVLARTEVPFYRPEEPFERTGQYAAGTTFLEGLVFHQGRWFLYYGCADSRVGAAVWEPAPAKGK